jgi:hypothetical protein
LTIPTVEAVHLFFLNFLAKPDSSEIREKQSQPPWRMIGMNEGNE